MGLLWFKRKEVVLNTAGYQLLTLFISKVITVQARHFKETFPGCFLRTYIHATTQRSTAQRSSIQSSLDQQQIFI